MKESAGNVAVKITGKVLKGVAKHGRDPPC
jgi:hypothetical protein